MIRPGVDGAHWAAVPDAAAGARRARSSSARSCRGSAPTSRSRSRRGSRTCGSTSPARRCRATRPAYAAALRARAARPDLAGRVRFLGAVADPRAALAAAHCLLHCADREPFGLALVEALAAGRPVVAPAAGGPLEIVTPRCGRLYAPGDAAAGAAALLAILADPAAPAPPRGRARRRSTRTRRLRASRPRSRRRPAASPTPADLRPPRQRPPVTSIARGRRRT